MWKAMKRWWKYRVAKTEKTFNEKADPKIQLEQAITEAQDQHRRLKEQAANVIANQKTSQLRLNDKMGELEKLNATARQALIMAADAQKTGNADKAAMVAAVRARGFSPADDNEADAIALLLWALETKGGVA